MLDLVFNLVVFERLVYLELNIIVLGLWQDKTASWVIVCIKKVLGCKDGLAME